MSTEQKSQISRTIAKYWENGVYANRKTTSHIPWNKGLKIKQSNI